MGQLRFEQHGIKFGSEERGEVMSGFIFQSIYIYTLVRSQVRFQGKRRSHEAGRF